MPPSVLATPRERWRRSSSAATCASGASTTASACTGSASVGEPQPVAVVERATPATRAPRCRRARPSALGEGVGERSTPPRGRRNIGPGVPARRALRVAACDPRIRLPCDRSHSRQFGERGPQPRAGRRRPRRARPASGATARSVASSPEPPTQQEPRVSSPPSFRLPRTRSWARGVSRPSRARASGTRRRRRPGCRMARPSAKSTRPWSVHRYEPGRSRRHPARPRSPAPCTGRAAHGLRARKESAPAGRTRSPTATLRSLPPTCGPASNTWTSSGGVGLREPVRGGEAADPAADDGHPTHARRRHARTRPRMPRGGRAPPAPARPGTRGRRWASACARSAMPASSAICVASMSRSNRISR